jgi:hypothetical protein
VDYVLGKHFATFYQAEKTPTDPPKGTYTFVAQCGMSGAVLGPPNYHDYQNKLRKLHAERFSRMPFEVFKSRIRIVRDEAVVKKWLEDQSWKTEYVALNVPETVKLTARGEVEQHFRQTHLANVIKSVDSHTLSGTAAQSLPTAALHRAVRRGWDEQMRFPLKIVNVLSQQFAEHGLQFFKVNKTVTHVAVARPRYLDLDLSPVSEGVRKIVDFIQQTPNCTRRKILEALAPAPASITPPAEAAPPGAEPPPTPEMAAVISDLHWLIHQGHVIEFAKGLIELARKPVPRPPKPEPAPVPEAAAAPAPASVPAPADTEPPQGDALAPAAAPEPSPAPEPSAAVEPAPSVEFAPPNPEPSTGLESVAPASATVESPVASPLTEPMAPPPAPSPASEPESSPAQEQSQA